MDDDRDEWTVKVFRESPAWDTCDRWWQLQMHVLQDLYVCAYTHRSYRRPSEESKSVQWIRQQHPNCVLVY